MRIDPEEKIIKKEELREIQQIKTDKITRKVALVVAFVSVYYFIIKIMFL